MNNEKKSPIMQVEFLALDEEVDQINLETSKHGEVDLLMVSAVIDEDVQRVCLITTGGDVLIKADYQKILYFWKHIKQQHYGY